MGLFDYELCLQSRFDCATPQSASPLNKRVHELPRVYDAKRPHVHIDVRLTTSGVFVDRANVNFYQGHVPDAPVMVGREQGDLYAMAAQKTRTWSPQRWLAIAGAALVGAVVGAAIAGISVGVVALVAHVGLTSVAASWQLFFALALVNASFDAAFFAGKEYLDWSSLHQQATHLRELCDIYQRRPHEGANARLLEADTAKVRWCLEQADWALQHAALELTDAQTAAAAASGDLPRAPEPEGRPSKAA